VDAASLAKGNSIDPDNECRLKGVRDSEKPRIPLSLARVSVGFVSLCQKIPISIAFHVAKLLSLLTPWDQILNLSYCQKRLKGRSEIAMEKLAVKSLTDVIRFD
jgi:hypothetical protein